MAAMPSPFVLTSSSGLLTKDGPKGILPTFSHGIPTLPLPPTLNEADFPDVPYWHKQSWDLKQNRAANIPPQEQSDGGSTARKQNKKLLCLTDKAGATISPNIQDQAAKLYFSCLNDLVPICGNTFPHTWGAAGLTFKAYCIRTLCQQYDFFLYCSGGWKPELFCQIKWGDWARTRLPGYIKEQKEERKRSAQEVISISDDEESSVPTKKVKAGKFGVSI